MRNEERADDKVRKKDGRVVRANWKIEMLKKEFREKGGHKWDRTYEENR